jgi:hypothetical protein
MGSCSSAIGDVAVSCGGGCGNASGKNLPGTA